MSDIELMRAWSIDFPQLADLHAAICNASAYGGWFLNRPQRAYSSDLALEWHRRLESELIALDADAWQSLRAKIVGQANSNLRELISLLNEAAGYGYLKNELSAHGVSDARITQPALSETKYGRPREPDWVAISGGQIVAALEVKTVFESDDQINYIRRNTQRMHEGMEPITKRLCPVVPDALLRKLDEHVAIAKRQLKTILPAPAILIAYLVVNIDHEAAQVPNCKEIIEDHLACLCEDDLIVVGNLRLYL